MGTRKKGISIQERSLLDAAGTFYEAALDDRRWPEALRRVLHLVEGASGSVSLLNLNAGSVDLFHSWREDPAFLGSYVDHYLAVNPYRPFMLTMKEAYTSDRMIPVDEIVKTEFYNEWQKPQGMDFSCGFGSQSADKRLALFNCNRPKRMGRFEDAEVSVLEALMPHFLRAVELSRRLWALRARERPAEEVLHSLRMGVLLIGERGEVLLANRRAEALARGREGITLRGSTLEAARVEEREALRKLIQQAVQTALGQGMSTGGDLALSRGTGADPLAVQVMPMRAPERSLGMGGHFACAAVFCAVPGEVPSPPAEVLRVLFRLTPAESALAADLAAGRTLEEHAEAQRISRQTARNQLKVVFSKTGTHRQSGLVRLMLSLPGSAVRPL